MNTTLILEQVAEQDDYVRNLRRYFHENPELSNQEFKTRDAIMAELVKIGLKPEFATSTGFIAVLDTGRPGKTLALRTDMDALPLHESKNNLLGPRKCCSRQAGVMHACGHDGHIAILLGAAKILTRAQEQISGKIIFVFEEGEENISGIHGMVEFLRDKSIDAFYGCHLVSFLDTGTMAADPGAVMAGFINVDMTIHGLAGHGSRPDFSINPVFAAAQVLSGISSAWNNRLNVEQTVTLGLTQIHAGNANNIIPDSAYIGGSLRYFDIHEGEKALHVIKDTAELTARAHGCTAEFPESFRIVLKPLMNHPCLAALACQGGNELYPGKFLYDMKWFASESFSEYRELAPVVFPFVGARNPKVGSGAEHHNELFDLDEDALQYAVGMMVKFTTDFLG